MAYLDIRRMGRLGQVTDVAQPCEPDTRFLRISLYSVGLYRTARPLGRDNHTNSIGEHVRSRCSFAARIWNPRPLAMTLVGLY